MNIDYPFVIQIPSYCCEISQFITFLSVDYFQCVSKKPLLRTKAWQKSTERKKILKESSIFTALCCWRCMHKRMLYERKKYLMRKQYFYQHLSRT
jgi:hypothetical protein